ncbi:hypothetical protein KP509_11G016200 [Ceratopteris richardii]|uniref:Cytochrome b561 domain-containing protein n=1 Tax=Ceratopteris richardii TaxID=49495 RepID=A0A8T2TPF0_CERRI|nr:hypothetical protein KP509_11G016200 [Ceratopteris richardii]
MGVIVARYVKPFADPAWFYAHITLQIVGYAMGVAGWVTGLNLNDEDATGGDPGKHGAIGGVLFGICTLQMLALFLRPKKEHKLRKVWNLYHYSLAASILILGIINTTASSSGRFGICTTTLLLHQFLSWASSTSLKDLRSCRRLRNGVEHTLGYWWYLAA